MRPSLTRLLQRGPRQLLSLTAKHGIYVSHSSDPYFNLSFEDWLFKEKPVQEPLLLIYRDKPCVIIGRNQNPWKEVNFPALHRANIPFIRRRSGGGTVYHDTGNTNFSIHLPRSSFNRHATAQLVLRAVRSLDIDARVNERNDICVGPYKMSIASIRSPVKNLQEFSPAVTHDKFVRAMIQAFREEYHVGEPVQYVQAEDATNIPYIQDSMANFPTPEFTYSIAAKIRSKHGLILSCSLTVEDTSDLEWLERLGRGLEGQRYGFLDNTVMAYDGVGRAQEVWQCKSLVSVHHHLLPRVDMISRRLE
ncbi:hypothetical protein BGY98DRAFT_986374 [Russula aff. rugulosa BPL654]|nr:hypothetical protein BGY98DRAFT_986374 [Russula aff. rugulosa BPL654]